jgi:hypothetical protein
VDDIILITGTARAGVSMIGGVVRLCGAWGGDSLNTTEYDGRGSFENEEIRDSIVRPFLRGIKADPLGQRPLPNMAECRRIAPMVALPWRRRIDKIVKSQGYGNGPLFYASPQSCLVWPVWAKAFPKARWIIVRRKDEDIINACMKTGFMTGHSDRSGWNRWLEFHKERFDEMVRANMNIWQIWPQRMIKGKLAELKDLVENLGLRWDGTAVEDFIAPILWKGGVFEVSDE